MALLYNPVDGSELNEPVTLYPRTAFLMLHDNDRAATIEVRMQEIARDELQSKQFDVKSASDLRRSGDYLAKIIRIIRGCGFGVAVFSDATPPKTLANIFFEIGYCLAIGKPTYLLLAGDQAVPSDFVRSEWINFDPSNEPAFREELAQAVSEIDQYGQYLVVGV